MTKEIELTRGQVALVDDCDYEELSKHKWTAGKSRGCFYAVRVLTLPNGKKRYVKMHRQILGLQTGDGKITDHINRNGLDNRKVNLRVTDHITNNRNRNVRKDNTSGYNGVSWHKYNQRWTAHIRVNGKRINLGTFANINDAIQARFKGELEHWGATREALASGGL